MLRVALRAMSSCKLDLLRATSFKLAAADAILGLAGVTPSQFLTI